ncbi:MAG: DUF3995 domain-containing protein [Rhizobiaceae bacterium]|nr:DUF3995 domain-containing protein [Rhizobiaceae bacterium]
MLIITIILVAIFLAIAIIHGMWGFKVWWPERDEQKLALRVVGRQGIKRMPAPVQCFAVTAIMFGAAILVLVLAGLWSLPILPIWLIRWAAIALAAGLLLRGLIGFTGLWARLLQEEPFRTYDRRYYSPLCLILAVGIVVLMNGV